MADIGVDSSTAPLHRRSTCIVRRLLSYSLGALEKRAEVIKEKSSHSGASWPEIREIFTSLTPDGRLHSRAPSSL